MAKIRVAHHPELTIEREIEVFKRHFGMKYQVYGINPTGRSRGRDLIVKKSRWTAVGVKLKQRQGETSFEFTAFTPSSLFGGIIGILISYLIMRPSWKAMEKEVAHFIRNAADFH